LDSSTEGSSEEEEGIKRNSNNPKKASTVQTDELLLSNDEDDDTIMIPSKPAFNKKCISTAPYTAAAATRDLADEPPQETSMKESSVANEQLDTDDNGSVPLKSPDRSFSPPLSIQNLNVVEKTDGISRRSSAAVLDNDVSGQSETTNNSNEPNPFVDNNFSTDDATEPIEAIANEPQPPPINHHSLPEKTIGQTSPPMPRTVTITDGNHSKITEQQQQQPPQPSQESFFLSLDNLFLQADVDTVTVKDIILAVEAEFNTSLKLRQRKLLKQRLRGLIGGTIIPMAASQLTPTPKKKNNRSDEQETNAKEQKGSDNSSMYFPKDINTTNNLELTNEHVARVSVDENSDIEIITEEAVNELLNQEVNMDSEKASILEKGSSEANNKDKREIVDKVNGGEPPAISSNENNAKAEPSTISSKAPVLKRQRRKAPRKGTNVDTAVAAVSEASLKVPEPVAAAKPPARKRQRQQAAPKQPRARKGTCSLCVTCPCRKINENNGGVTHIFGEENFHQNNNDKELEKSLIKRQKKLEKTVDKYESDLDLVTRHLKKHRRAMMKVKEAELNANKRYAFGKSRFLPDVNVWDSQLKSNQRLVVMSPNTTKRAQHKMFGPLAHFGFTKNGNTILETVEEGDSQKDDNHELCSDSDEFMEDDNEEEEITEIEQPADNFSRISWKNGNRDGSATPFEQPVWPSVAVGGFGEVDSSNSATWDNIFSSLADSDEPPTHGFEELLDLFQDCTQKSQHQEQHQEDDNNSAVNLSQLSQAAQELAISIENKVTSNPSKLQQIETSCPNWKENVRFALTQRKDEDTIQAALKKLQKSRRRMDQMKEDFLAAWNRKVAVLDLFEMSMAGKAAQDDGEIRPDAVGSSHHVFQDLTQPNNPEPS